MDSKFSIGSLFVIMRLWLVNGADFQVKPSTIIIGGRNPTASLDISCTPNLPGLTSVFILEIGKKSQSGTTIPVIQIDNTNRTSVVIKDISLQQRLSTSGSISGSTGSLMMSLKDLRCEDATSYYCRASVNTASGSANDDGGFNVTAQVNPGTIEMVVTPRKLQYEVGEKVTFSCYGRIGNREGRLETLWTWQYRYTDSSNPKWTTYPNNHINVTYQPRQPTGSCQYTSGSVLSHVMTSADNGREFRCFFYNEVYEGNYVVYRESETTTTSTSTATPEHVRTGGSVQYAINSASEISFDIGVSSCVGLMMILVVF